MLNFFKQLVTSGSGTSSKRFSGMLGWLVCLIICFYCTIKEIQAPDVVDFLFVCSTSLLGIDSVANIFSKKTNKDICINK